MAAAANMAAAAPAKARRQRAESSWRSKSLGGIGGASIPVLVGWLISENENITWRRKSAAEKWRMAYENEA
jgi:hypothetical protein